MLVCTAFCKKFYINIPELSYLYSYCRLMYKIEERKYTWKSGYNFVHILTLQIAFLTVNILECIYEGFLLAS